MFRIEYSPSFNTSIPMKLDQKRKKKKDQTKGLIGAGDPSRVSSIWRSEKPRDFHGVHIFVYL